MLEKKSLIINFFGGSYGNFVETLITENCKEDNIDLTLNNFHKTTKESSIFNIKKTHDNEHLLDELNLKISYSEEHIDLISRNVWSKLPNHLIEKTDELFNNCNIDIDYINKKIITIAFYKDKLLHGLNKWNKLLKESTVELPFDYFFTDKENWLNNWKKLLEQLGIKTTDQYIINAYNIFNHTQKSLIEEHNFYKRLKWSEQDVIGKGNHLGELYFQKHSQNTVPIDIVKYKDTKHMLSEWINEFDIKYADI
jgi:hypothetical protein